MKIFSKTNKRTRSIIALLLACILTLAVGYIGINGMWLDNKGLYKLLPWIPNTDVQNNWPDSIKLGLDLKGGVYVEYEAKLPEDINNMDFELLLKNTIDIMATRLTDKGFPEATVVQFGTNGIRVEIPDVQDPNAILDLIGSPAKLEFLDPDGNVFMEGKHLQTAVAAKDNNAQPVISFTLTPEGAKIFADMTSKNIGKTLAIQLDGQKIMEPTVNDAILTGSGIISNLGTMERAQTIALQIQSGALPLEITQQKVDTISATLGIDALEKAVFAAIIGIALVMLLMILRYRLSGFVASWAIVIYIIMLFFFIAIIPGIQLTLPGIAGIVLGIGMAVDANIIICERFKEEIISGRPVAHAFRLGYKNALSAIIDANITTIIAAIVLLGFGTGSIKGFAITLLLGVLVSMLSAIVISKYLLRNFINIFNKTSLYTHAKAKEVEA